MGRSEIMSEKAAIGLDILYSGKYKLLFDVCDDNTHMSLYEPETGETFYHIHDIDLSSVFEQVTDIVELYEQSMS